MRSWRVSSFANWSRALLSSGWSMRSSGWRVPGTVSFRSSRRTRSVGRAGAFSRPRRFREFLDLFGGQAGEQRHARGHRAVELAQLGQHRLPHLLAAGFQVHVHGLGDQVLLGHAEEVRPR